MVAETVAQVADYEACEGCADAEENGWAGGVEGNWRKIELCENWENVGTELES